MLNQIDRLMHAMREVSDNVAHDLRSPLTRLKSRLELTLLGDGNPDQYRQAIEQADPAAAALLQQLAVEDTEADVDEVICRLVATAARAALEEIQSEFRSSPEMALERADVVGWLKLTTEQLDERRTRIDAASRLVPWLLSRGEEMAAHE